MVSGSIIRAVCALVLLTMTCQSAKILLLTSPTFSHCAEVSGVGHGLLDKGHQVHIVIGSTFKHKHCFDKGSNGSQKIQPIIFQDSPDVLLSSDLMKTFTSAGKDGEEDSMFQHIATLKMVSITMCTNMFYDKKAFNRLKEEAYDMVIIDTTPVSYCLHLVPVKLGVPYASVSSYFGDTVSSRPSLPAIVPTPLLAYTDSMSYLQKLRNALSYLAMAVVVPYVASMEPLYEIAPGYTHKDLSRLVAKSELFLYNYDPILSYPVPTMPNHVLVGGIAAGPAKSLPPNLQKFYDSSQKPIVLVTFGSNIDTLQTFVDHRVRRALSRLDANVLWRHSIEGETGNIKTAKWLPQNDLLGNSKTKVFVSHCGNNGVFEALYHGVPIVCTPKFGDQFYQGVRVEHWKAGKTVSLMASSEEELFEAISTVLKDPTYAKNMKKASEMYHSRPMTARKRAAFWVEHVMKFGGEHLRSRATEMSYFSFMGFDLVCFGCVCLLVTLCCCLKCSSLTYRRCCRKPMKAKIS